MSSMGQSTSQSRGEELLSTYVWSPAVGEHIAS